ncbi:MAG: hypothetical protein ACT4QE_22980, partial [Anaerolineales bacterium]
NRGTLTVRLRGSPAAPDLAVHTLAAESVSEEMWVALEFAPRVDSFGQTYYFQLDAAEATPSEAVTALVRPAATYAEGAAYRNGQPIEGDLTFRAYFSVDVFTRVAALLTQLIEDRPGLWGSPLLYIAVGLGYIALIVAVARQSLTLRDD